MLKTLFSLLKNPQLLLPLVLFGAGFFIMSLAWSSYQEQAGRELPDLSQKAEAKEPTSVQEIKSEFAPSVGIGEDFYDVIAQDNLFHRNREAWQPPEPKKDSQEENQDQDRNKERGKQRMARISHSKIRLYGTTSSKQGKTALLYMDPFQANPKYRLAREGEIVRDEGERGEWLYYKVVDIDQDRVALEASDGESVQISLYGHQRQQKRQSAKNKEQSIQVVVGGEQIAHSEKSVGPEERKAPEDNGQATPVVKQIEETEQSESSERQEEQKAQPREQEERGSNVNQAEKESSQDNQPRSLADAFRKMLKKKGSESPNEKGNQPKSPLEAFFQRNK